MKVIKIVIEKQLDHSYRVQTIWENGTEGEMKSIRSRELLKLLRGFKEKVFY